MKIELISKKYEECSREKARAFKPECKRLIFFSYKFFLNEMKKITSKRYRYMQFEKYKKQVHTKFTQKITFGNNIKIKYPYNINIKIWEQKN
mgnify:FL=1